MTDSSDNSIKVSQLANEYLARCRNGEAPPLSEYTDKHPQLAEDIREIFPMMLLMEENAPNEEPNEHEPLELSQFGDFRIKREIGRGGMGVVYEAVQESLNRNVALKVCPLNTGMSSRNRLRFRRESRAAAMLHHTNIVPVFAVGEEEGSLYYAMQLIRGATLDEVIEELRVLLHTPDSTTRFSNISVRSFGRSVASEVASSLVSASDSSLQETKTPSVEKVDNKVSLPGQSTADSQSGLAQYWDSVARIGIQAADALSYAHGQGTLHRDIKPGNLMLDEKGIVWVLDFGLAKSLEEDDLTRDGELIGTLRYMSPEQCKGNPGPRSDIYSLGLTLYELLTFQPAFVETHRTELLRAIAEKEPTSPRKINRKVPRDLETIVMKTIDRDPKRRYSDAEALRADLTRFLNGEPIAARRISTTERVGKWVRRRPMIASLCAALLMLFLTSFALVSWKWREAEAARTVAENKEREASTLARAERDALKRASESLEKSEQLIYRSTINRAQVTSKSDMQTSRKLLQQLIPKDGETDRRDWEWGYLTNLVHQELAVLKCGADHPLWIWDIKFSDDNSLVAVGAGRTEFSRPYADVKGRVTVWDPRTAELIQEIPVEHTGYSVAISSDNQRIAVSDIERSSKFIFACSWIGPTWLWDLKTGEKLVQLEKDPETKVDELTFSTDGNVIFGTTWPKYRGYGTPVPLEFAAWDVQTGKKIWAVEKSQLVRVIDGGEQVELKRVKDGGLLRQIVNFSDQKVTRNLPATYFDTVLSSNGQFAVSGTSIRLTDLISRQWKALSGDDNYLVRQNGREPVCEFHPDNSRLFAGATDGGIRVWNMSHTTLDKVLRGHNATINEMAFSKTGKWLASGDWNGEVRLWQPDDASDQVNLMSRFGIYQASYIEALTFDESNDGVSVCEAGDRTLNGDVRRQYTQNGWLNTFEAAGGNLISESKIDIKYRYYERNAEFDAKGKRLVFAEADESISVLHVQTRKKIFTTGVLAQATHEVAISASGEKVACSIQDMGEGETNPCELLVWDVDAENAKAPIWHRRFENARITALTLDGPGQRVAFAGQTTAGGLQNFLRVHDLSTSKTVDLETFSGRDEIKAIEFSKDGNQVAVCDLSGVLNVYQADPKSNDLGKRLFVAETGPGAIFDLAWNPNGTRLAGVNRESVTLWDTNGEVVMTLKGDQRYSDLQYEPMVRFSHDGKRIAASQWSNHVRIWSAADDPERLLSRDNSSSSLGPQRHSAKVLGALASHKKRVDENPWLLALRGQLYAKEKKAELALADYVSSKRKLSGGDPCILLHGNASIVAPPIPFDQFESCTIETWVRGGWYPHKNYPILASQVSSKYTDKGTHWSQIEQRRLKSWATVYDGVHFVAPVSGFENEQWTHLAVCSYKDGRRIFVNGVEVRLAPPTNTPIRAQRPWPSIDGAAPFRIGGTVFGDDLPQLRCLMRSFRVSSKALYSGSFDPQESLEATDDTVMLFDFSKEDSISNDRFEDQSGNEFHGKLINAWWQD